MATENKSTRGRVKLTTDYVNEIRATGKRESYRDETVNGLILRVSPDAESKVWYLDYRNQDGQRKLYRIGPLVSYKVAAAKKEAIRLQGKIADGEDIATEKQTARKEARIAKQRTLRKYVTGQYWSGHLVHLSSGKDARNRILRACGKETDTDMASLNLNKIKRNQEKRRKAGISPHTLNRDRAALMSCLNHAVENEVIPANPLAGWKPLGRKDGVSSNVRVRYLGQRDDIEKIKINGKIIGERIRFLQAVNDPALPDYFRPLVMLAYYTGMRRGDIFKLNWSDINFTDGYITLQAVNTKAGKAHNTPLNKEAIKILKQWRDRTARNIQGYVFPNPKTGKPFTNIDKAWDSFEKLAQLTGFRFHDIRHDFCSRLVMNGRSLIEVSRLVGHASTQMTERYAHLAPDHLRDAVAVAV